LVQIRFDDFVGETAMPVRIAAQRAHPELAAGLQSTDDGAALLPGCAEDGDQFVAVC
jgi:hypothetical protein